jgi:hypothetical protein
MLDPFLLTGFDPLDEAVGAGSTEKALFEEATKRVVLNILRSYTGYYDIFSETIQNSLDALDEKKRSSPDTYRPRLWILIDVGQQLIRVVDNGIGMTVDQFKYCFRPNVSFKKRREGRGHKGVGATFLAYNYDHIRLQSKRDGRAFSVVLSQGRSWAEDVTGSVPRPTFIEAAMDAPELLNEETGTCIEIRIGQHRPILNWLSASSANQWYDVLRVKTPLGGIYLHTPEKQTEVTGELVVRDIAGSETRRSFARAEYFYPHDLQNLYKVKSVSEIEGRISSLAGDLTLRFQRIGEEFKRLDAVWEVWTNDDIIGHSVLARNLSDEQKELIGRHRVYIYGCFVSTAKTWTDFQSNHLKIRKSPLLVGGGMQLASDFMVQGDPFVIPLTSTIGYQNNTHVVLHLIDGNPDMGRKVFQPEIKAVADELSRRVVDVFKGYLALMREDTGAPGTRASNELFQFKVSQLDYRKENSLDLTVEGKTLAMKSVPQKEQDVIALFHEMLGATLLKGYNILATSEHERYDCIFLTDFKEGHSWTREQLLGVSDLEIGHGESEPKVLEYKVDLDGLIADIENEKKFPKDVDLLVCWTMGNTYKDSFSIKSYLWDEEGSVRSFYGATHAMYKERERILEIICLQDLIRYLKDPVAVSGEQKVKYR